MAVKKKLLDNRVSGLIFLSKYSTSMVNFEPVPSAVVQAAEAGSGSAELFGVVETVCGADVAERLLQHVHHGRSGRG